MRTGMTNLVNELRAMTNVGTADYTLGTVTYFTDDQLQTELDKTQSYARSVGLTPLPIQSAGSLTYLDYQWPAPMGYWLEDYAGNTTSGWAVRSTLGATVGTADYSVNFQARRVTFTANTLGAAYNLDARTYDLNHTAANIWRWKAAHVANRVDWSSDNHSVKSSQEKQACLDMAEYYQSQGGLTVGRFVRSDENLYDIPDINPYHRRGWVNSDE